MSNSLLGAIQDYYVNGVSTDVSTLRTDLGTGKMFAGEIPDNVSFPAVSLSQIDMKLVESTVKTVAGVRYWVEDRTIAFDLIGPDLPSLETIVDDLISVYLYTQLTLSNRTHMGTYLDNLYFQQTGKEIANAVWVGTLELRFRLQKS